MRRWIRAAISNSPAMNTLTITVLLVGLGCLMVMRRETFPQFELEIVLVQVLYPGASPEEVEQGICQKIEESVQAVDGIKKMTSVAGEGSGSVVLELNADVKNVQKVVSEVRSAVDRIPSFPELAEDPEVQQITFRESAIKLAVMAPEGKQDFDLLELRAVAEQVRDELLQLKTVAQVDLTDVPDYQIDIEIDESNLRKYGLSLQRVASIVRRENLEVPGGTIRGQGEEILLRGEDKRLIGQEIEKLPLITDQGGSVLTIGDIGNVKDEFRDKSFLSEVNGRPALVLDIQRTKSEDLLQMAADVRQFATARELPGGYEMRTWADQSVDVEDRLNLLISNGTMGLILVFLVLAVFLELKLAFWVAVGIPVSLLGAGGILMLSGQTLNMLSMFSFLMALGIVVDDAIVVGENIYATKQSGVPPLRAAIVGTIEVMPSVIASVATTVIAFCPLFFVSGVMGKFIAVMPLAVIAMLTISLCESMFVLPSHLSHDDNLLFRIFRFFLYPLGFVVRFFERVNQVATRLLERFIEGVYVPVLRVSLEHRWTTVATAFTTLLLTFGFVRAGLVPFIVFPKLDSNQIRGTIAFPDGTPQAMTNAATERLVDSLRRVEQRLSGGVPLIRTIHRTVGAALADGNAMREGLSSGGHIGAVQVELVDTTEREVHSNTIINEWRKEVGEIAGTDSLVYGTPSFGPGGKALEFKLLANAENFATLEEAVEKCKEKLTTYDALYDIDDDSRPGKWEYRVRVKEDAQSLGVTTGDIADTLRANYYGAEVMRLQRGRHEVKLMVRYPQQDRRSLADFNDIWIRTNDGTERPITEVAEIDVVRGYSEINRIEQKRSITISADIDEQKGNARSIVAELQADFMPQLLQEYNGVNVRWEGQQEQTQESVRSLGVATIVALLAMFVLLTLEFKAYLQPFLIMSVIPFGIIGAILGHALMGLPITLFSFFGLVALTGVVVNDSIVLIDFINHRVKPGEDLDIALIDAGRRRFRPVMLTSATTVAGLLPILLERSFQAQLLIPMATSLSFGLMMTTVLVLVMIPTFYRIYVELVGGSAAVHPQSEPVEVGLLHAP